MYAEIVFEKKTENDVAIAISSVLRSPTMEELADLATSELLQQEIDRLRVDNEHLQGSLLESQQHCHRLEEEASLLISGVKQQHDETDEDFKKRNRKSTIDVPTKEEKQPVLSKRKMTISSPNWKVYAGS
jgi:hypothetical protein